MNILLIEDEFRIAEFVAHGLEGAGYQVQHAADGELGLAMVRERALTTTCPSPFSWKSWSHGSRHS